MESNRPDIEADREAPFLLSQPPSLGEEREIPHDSADQPPTCVMEAISEAGPNISSFSFTTGFGTTIQIDTLVDVLSRSPEDRQWTVKGILPDCGLAILGGRAKKGKSTLAIHLERCVAMGEYFLKRETQQRVVVYVNYEMPMDYFSALSKAEPVPRQFYIINRPEQRLKPETIRAVIHEFKALGFAKGLLVIDSFRGAFKLKAEEENQAGEAGVILRTLQEIGVQTEWLILVIHHHKKNATGEGADNLSGTSDFGAAPDVIWTWERPADVAKPGVLKIEGRIEPIDPMVVRLSPDECTWVENIQDSNAHEEKTRILNALNEETLVARELAERIGIPYSTVKKRLNSLQDEGKVGSRTRKGKGSPQEWFRSIQESRFDPPEPLSS